MTTPEPSQLAASIRNYLRLAYHIAEQPGIVEGQGIDGLTTALEEAASAAYDLRDAVRPCLSLPSPAPAGEGPGVRAP